MKGKLDKLLEGLEIPPDEAYTMKNLKQVQAWGSGLEEILKRKSIEGLIATAESYGRFELDHTTYDWHKYKYRVVIRFTRGSGTSVSAEGKSMTDVKEAFIKAILEADLLQEKNS